MWWWGWIDGLRLPGGRRRGRSKPTAVPNWSKKKQGSGRRNRETTRGHGEIKAQVQYGEENGLGVSQDRGQQGYEWRMQQARTSRSWCRPSVDREAQPARAGRPKASRPEQKRHGRWMLDATSVQMLEWSIYFGSLSWQLPQENRTGRVMRAQSLGRVDIGGGAERKGVTMRSRRWQGERQRGRRAAREAVTAYGTYIHTYVQKNEGRI